MASPNRQNSSLSVASAERLERLLALPFAQKNEVVVMTLQDVEMLLDDMAASGADGDSELATFRDDYCQWLLATESEGFAAPADTALGMLLSTQAKEERSPAIAPPDSFSLDATFEEPASDVSLWSVVSVPQLSLAKPPEPKAPEVRAAPLTAPAPKPSAEAPAALWGQPTAPTPPIALAPIATAAPEVIRAKPAAVPAPKAPVALEPKMSDLVNREVPVRRFGTWPGGTHAREFLDLAAAVESLSREAIPPRQVERLVAESLCFAVESECQFRFASVVEAMWPQRAALLGPILSSTATRPAFAPAAQQFLRQTEERSRAVSAVAVRLPDAALLHSLRYLLVCLRREHFAPTLLDYGTLVLFFGAGRFGEETGFVRLAPAEASDLGLLLLRLQRLRNEALNIAHFWDRSKGRAAQKLLEEVTMMAERALRLLSEFPEQASGSKP